MPSLATTYLGLPISCPLIVSSSGLTSTVEKIEKLAQTGAGAVVLKSVFEEQIMHEASAMIEEGSYPEASDYIMNYVKGNSLETHLQLIEGAKKHVKIPIIASINCFSAGDWASFAKSIEQAGADALELNIFFIPVDNRMDSANYETMYYRVVETVKKETTLPLSVKLGDGFTHPVRFVKGLFDRGVSGVVLFNRLYSPDIDIEGFKFTSADVLSSPTELYRSLRWVGIVSAKVSTIEVAASTGVHNGAAVVKQLLAGAQAVQVCSALYKSGVDILEGMNRFLTDWMTRHGYNTVEGFRGKMNYKQLDNPAIYERSQFMKYFSNHQ